MTQTIGDLQTFKDHIQHAHFLYNFLNKHDTCREIVVFLNVYGSFHGKESLPSSSYRKSHSFTFYFL